MKIALLIALLLMPVGAQADDLFAPGLHENVIFTGTTPLASNAELVRRALPPLVGAHLMTALAGAHQSLTAQPVTPTNEKFTLYIPARKPAAGYGLLVFVAPWDHGRMPQGWAPVLDDKGIIYVAALASGNAAEILSRRMPLALIAAANVMARAPIDPARVFVGGMSGGSKVAMRLALAYPDLFRGALLNAGSDTIADAGAGTAAPLPPRDLFTRFQDGSRLIYATGAQDEINLRDDGTSAHSMRRWCMFNLEMMIEPHLGHETADPATLARALERLSTPPAPDAQLADCRAGVEADLQAQLDQVAALIAGGNKTDARHALTRIDQQFGGLAAPRSQALDAALGQMR